MDATGISEFDATSMIVSVLRSDFTISLLGEWMELEMPDISYQAFIETEVENLAGFMQGELREMMDIDTHLSMIVFLRELAKLKAQS